MITVGNRDNKHLIRNRVHENVATCSSPCLDVSGKWRIEEVIHDSCEDTYKESRFYTVTQKDCNITVKEYSEAVTGKVKGNHIFLEESYPEEGGVTTINVNVEVSGDTLSGSAYWTWWSF